MSAAQDRRRATADRKLIAATGNPARRYVPGSLSVAVDGHMDWTERCRANCPHKHGECWSARCGLAPREEWM